MVAAPDLLTSVQDLTAELSTRFEQTLSKPGAAAALTGGQAEPAPEASDEVHDHHTPELVIVAASILMAAEFIASENDWPLALTYDPARPAWRVSRIVQSEGQVR